SRQGGGIARGSARGFCFSSLPFLLSSPQGICGCGCRCLCCCCCPSCCHPRRGSASCKLPGAPPSTRLRRGRVVVSRVVAREVFAFRPCPSCCHPRRGSAVAVAFAVAVALLVVIPEGDLLLANYRVPHPRRDFVAAGWWYRAW